ncbi:MAG TPA: bifunctional hydroxymethylpyrimidine kinase/phosphomethylpyrimidine kinase, partial [Pseudolabrys sp.]|nr:bifunctional hydroxymethylpyrimidine kinase/phosphomethylpyrimidine kinase [Pseudolabrys sp.]
VFDDLDVGAVKIGMLSRAETIHVVADRLRHHRANNVVLDPVMIATSGARLIDEDAVEALRELIPRALVVTPNLPEAAALTGATPARNENEMTIQARELLTRGANNVLIKGGHAEGAESVDLLVGTKLGMGVRFAAPRVSTRATHGSGCTLSSAIAAGLAKGLDLIEAVQQAKTFVSGAIAAADQLKVGRGYGPLHHFHAHW